MSFLDDLQNGFNLLAPLIGDMESRDALPPPGPAVVLSVRTQRFLNVLLGPKATDYQALVDLINAHYGDTITAKPGSIIKSLVAGDPDAQPMRDAASKVVGNLTWTVPYLQVCGDIAGGYYTGGTLTNALAALNCSSNDFVGEDQAGWALYGQPVLDVAKDQLADLSSIPGVVDPGGPFVMPPTPPWIGARIVDNITGNGQTPGPNFLALGLLGGGLVTVVALAVGAFILLHLAPR